MHPNVAFRTKLAPEEERQYLVQWVRDIGFGSIFMTTPDGPRVAHAPFVCADGKLQFHLARGNALTKHIAGSVALAVAGGPNGYVSPDYYIAANQLPTWNYISIELEGPVRAMDQEGLIALLDDLGAVNEAKLAPKEPWTRDKMDDAKFHKMLGGIIGFEMEVMAWRPTLKLSQNKTEAERMRVADELEKLGKKAMAHFMREWVK